MKYRVGHPSRPGIWAEYGFDHAIGFFAEVVGDGLCQSYDALQPAYDHERPLLGALLFIVNHGFFTLEDLHVALSLDFSEGIGRSSLDRVAKVVADFKRSADQG